MMADSFPTDVPTTDENHLVNSSDNFTNTDNYSISDYTNDDLLPVNDSTNSTDFTVDYDYSIWDDPVAIATPAVFAIIFVVGLVGNATLIFIVLRNKPMRTKPNVLIVNLSIGDFLLILFSVPFTSVKFTFLEWPFGNAICKINEFMQTLSLGVSIFTLMALSGERFIAIVYPLASYGSRSLTPVVLVSLFIWVISIGLALMDLVGAHVGPCPHCEPQIQICNLYPEEWGEWYKAFRVIFQFVVYFALPVIVIVCLYVIIAVVLLRQAFSPKFSIKMGIKATLSPAPPVTRAPRLRERSESVAMAKQKESRKKVAKVVLSFVVIFVVCWLPRHVYVMSFQLYEDFEWNIHWYVLRVVGFCLMFIYSASNPLSLYLLNAEYRRYFHHYLFGCCYKPWRLKYTGTRRSTASSFTGRSTCSVLNRETIFSDNPTNRDTSSASVTTENLNLVSESKAVAAITNEDDLETRL